MNCPGACVCQNPPQPSEMEVESQVHLYGHTGEVTSLFVCKPYSILISVSKDGTCILWDLNRWVNLTYGGWMAPVSTLEISLIHPAKLQ